MRCRLRARLGVLRTLGYTYPGRIGGLPDIRKLEGTEISRPSIARSTATMSTATALSRVTGFIRMWATAFALGATGLMSSYSVANNIPNMIFELVAGGVLSAVFIPSFLELRESDGEDSAWRFASHVFNLVVLALGIVAVIGTLFPEPFIWTQTFRLPQGESEAVRELGAFFFSFFAIQVVVYGAGMVMQGVLNAQRRYLWPALGPVFNNIVVIVTMIVVAFMPVGRTSLTVLAVGTTLGVVAMFAVMVPSLLKSGVRYTTGLGFHDPTVRRMFVLAVPTVIYVITNLVAVSFRNASAFAVDPAGPSQLMYAWTFYQLPYGILAVALATAVFTELAETAGQKDWGAFKDNFGRGLRATLVLMLPCAALLIALAEPLVGLYRVGRFTTEDIPAVAQVLQLWALGLVFFALMMYVLRTYYSLKDTVTPAIANLALTAVQIGLYVLLTTGVGTWEGLGINGIPIADGVFYALLFSTLAVLLRKKIGSYDLAGTARTFGVMTLAAAVGGVVAWGIAEITAPLLPGFAGSLLQVTLGGIGGLAVAFGLGRLMGVREITSGVAMVRRVLARRSAKRTS